MFSAALIYGQNCKTQFEPKMKGPTSSSKDKISLIMNLTIWTFQIRKLTLRCKEHSIKIYTSCQELQILFSYYWVRDRIPTLMQEKSFQTLGQKQQVSPPQHTLKWRVFLQKCLMVVRGIEDESRPICFNMQLTCPTIAVTSASALAW